MTDSVSSQEKNLYLLKVLAESQEPLTVQDLLKTSGFSKSTLYRQLGYLKRWGFICEYSGHFFAGAIALQLGSQNNYINLLKSCAYPALKHLSEVTGETVTISVVHENLVFCVQMIEGKQALRCSIEKNRSNPLNRGATAKCLLAQFDQKERIRSVRSIVADRIKQVELLDELDQIKKDGYATSEGELDKDVWGVSSPISLFENGTFYSSISLMAPVFRVGANQGFLIAETKKAAQKIKEINFN
ncbi:IclR family transcriptional regulator [Ectopseudomonas oleovorans]|uniref:HTH-type transcriptional repressor AllR n=1 Tax=Ectopseudomonas oleovorans TaxID=301 RepID=A0AA42QA02_ECTOL|nr:IclR family transcriptional regulator [Pseudomonas oleovorans]MDH1339026.1 IclR family transcriptional regulator [Pseudomonas oleovorans]MDH1492012.1 IclR family transcriptional regulator [Pseudomonas oleovorans]WGG20927.1 IclR family transcriptional regulator [Pseudomonas oleovorans]